MASLKDLDRKLSQPGGEPTPLLQSGILHDYQQEGAQFLIDTPKSNLWWQPGLGKTLATLTMLDTVRPKQTLLVAPLRCCVGVWPAEIEKWAPHLTYKLILGSPAERRQALRSDADILLLNYEKLLWLIADHLDVLVNADCVIFDEASKMKNPGSQRFKKIRKPLAKVPRVHGLTGTPAPNGLLNVWSQVYLLDQGVSLSTPFSRFRERFFDSDYMGYNWTVKDPARIYKRLEGLCHVLRKDPDAKLVPVPVPVPVMTPAYEAMRAHGITGDIIAESEAVVQMKLRQLANGFIYDEDKVAHHIHGHKVTACKDLVEELEGQPVIIFYEFQEDLKRLQQAFPTAVLFDDSKLARWNRGAIEILLMSPVSAGHGLNMQESGNNIIWYGPPWDLEIHDQAIARLWRQGQKAEEVFTYYLVGDETLDSHILDVLTLKERDQSDLMHALEHHRSNSQD